jgi:hypothetical protein
MTGVTRRDFLKKSGLATAALGAASSLELLLSGCAASRFQEKDPIVFSPLIGHKVQPAENGCYIGFHGRTISDYKRELGLAPKIIIPNYLDMDMNVRFMTRFAEAASAEGATIFQYRILSLDIPLSKGFENLQNDKNFRQGLEKFAEGITKFGKPMFFCTMHEMNLAKKYAPYPWCDQPTTFKKIWKHMWQIFEDKGANEYATWVMEYHVDFPLEGYYPGDKFVDWIGLSAYNRAEFRHH